MARKELKDARPQAPAPQAPAGPPKVSFDAWWAMVYKRIEGGHHKEIILADFKARGLSLNETMAAYNEALAAYGIKLY